MSYKNTLFALTLLVPTLGIAQSAPLLNFSIGPSPNGGEALLARNVYTSPVEEYVIVLFSQNPTITTCAPKDHDAHGQCVTVVTTEQRLPHVPVQPGEPDPSAIAPGASRVIANKPKSLVLYEDIAVIYADGAMAGAPSVLNQMLRERQLNLKDAQQDLHMVQRIEAAPHPDWAKLARRFKRRMHKHDKLLAWAGPGGAASAPLYGHQLDIICRNVEKELQGAANTNRGPGPLPGLDKYLNWAIHQLHGPPLDSTNGN